MASVNAQKGATDDDDEIVALASLPRVSITSPSAGGAFDPPGTGVISVVAFPPMVESGTALTKVELFDGTTKLGEVNNPVAGATLNFNVSGLANGKHTITAKVTDAKQRVGVSSALALAITTKPTVDLISPLSGAAFEDPDFVTFTAAASDADGNIQRVEFYAGNFLVGTSATNVGGAFSVNWTTPIAGNFNVTAVAYDNLGAARVSTAVAIFVKITPNMPPTITLAMPSLNATYYTPATVPFVAQVNDVDGSIAKVEFFQGSPNGGSTLLFTDTVAPYEYNWANVGIGTYAVFAKVTDNRGATAEATGSVSVTNQPQGILTTSTPSITFAARDVGTDSDPQTVTFQNSGNAYLSVTGVQLAGMDFWVTSNGCAGVGLSPGQTCSMAVKVRPIAAGQRVAVVAVTHSGGNGTVQVSLTGTGNAGLKFSGVLVEDYSLQGNSGSGCKPGWDCIQIRTNEDNNCDSFEITGEHTAVVTARTCTLGLTWGSGQLGSGIGIFTPTGTCPGASEPDSPSHSSAAFADSAVNQWREVQSFKSDWRADWGTNAPLDSQLQVADPVHAAIGAKSHAQTDYVSASAPYLAAYRTYQSLAPKSSFSRRIFNGAGWFQNWDMSVTLEAAGAFARVHRGDGTSWVFTKQPDGTWRTNVDAGYLLERRYDGSGAGLGWRLSEKNNYENYDLQGRLLSIVLASGQQYVLTYDQSDPNRLRSVTDPFGKSLNYTYDLQGRLTEIVDPAGGKTLYGYDSAHRLISVVYADGRTRQYRYEHSVFKFALTSIANESGQTQVTFDYDDQGRALGNVFAGDVGRSSLSYMPDNSSISSDPTSANATVSRQFQNYQGNVRTTNMQYQCTGCGVGGSNTLSESFTYDANGFPASHTNRAGIVTTSVYDSRGLPTSVTTAAGTPLARTVTTVWHPVFRLPAQINEPTRTTVYQYDAQGRKLSEAITADGQTRTTTYTYNAQGLLATVDGPRTDVNDITSYTYDAQGRLATVTNPKGQVTAYNSYDAHGNVLSMTDVNGVVTTYTYDARSRLLTHTVAGQTTTHTYNLNGLKATTTDPYGGMTTFLYDAANRFIGKDLSNGDKERYTLDNAGRIIMTERFDSANVKVTTTSTVYDGLGRVKQRVDANNKVTSYTYDVNGNVTAVTDPNNLTTTTAYDVLNRPILVTDPLGKTVSYGYNVQDKIATVTDPNNNTTSYTYSGFGENTQTVSPDTGTTTQTFNPAGSVLTRTDARGKTAVYTYDVLGRMTQVSYLDGNTTHTYDVAANGVGQLASVTDPSGSTTFTYDAYGRVASKAVNIGGVTKTLAYTRDSVGRVTSITYPSGKVLGLLYNNGKVDDMTWQGNPLILDIQYFPFGGPESWLFNGNREYTRFTDLNGRTERYLTSSGFRKLTFDDAGRITQIGDHLGSNTTPNATQAFGYDNAGRLVSFNGFTSAGNQTQSFTYDNNGNRLSSVLNGANSTYTYQTGNNRLASVTGSVSRTNTYDATGNLTSNGSHTYTYNDRGRLTQALAGGLTTTYSLNYQNLRVKKTNSQETRLFVYDEAGQMLGEYDQAGNPVQELIWLGSTPVAVSGTLPVPCGTAGSTQQGSTCTLVNAVGYIWTDHLSTPREITVPTPTQQDAAQHTSIWKWDSLPFGETNPNENPNSLGTMTFNHRFPGQYRDSESGLSQNWHRDYDAILGRYVQYDLLGMLAGTNPYGYVKADPIRRTDPQGLNDMFPGAECPNISPENYEALINDPAAMDAVLNGQDPGYNFLKDYGDAYVDFLKAAAPVFGGPLGAAIAKAVDARKVGIATIFMLQALSKAGPSVTNKLPTPPTQTPAAVMRMIKDIKQGVSVEQALKNCAGGACPK